MMTGLADIAAALMACFISAVSFSSVRVGRVLMACCPIVRAPSVLRGRACADATRISQISRLRVRAGRPFRSERRPGVVDGGKRVVTGSGRVRPAAVKRGWKTMGGRRGEEGFMANKL